MPMLKLSQKEWNHHRQASETRRDALKRLYARRDAVDYLIRSIEQYQRADPPRQVAFLAALAPELRGDPIVKASESWF